MSYEDLKEHGSESAVKASGKLRQQGKPYESARIDYFSLPFGTNQRQLPISGRRRYRVLEGRELIARYYFCIHTPVVDPGVTGPGNGNSTATRYRTTMSYARALGFARAFNNSGLQARLGW